VFYLFCRDGEDTKHFSHDLHNGIPHACGQCYLGINRKPSKDILDALKSVDEYHLTVGNNRSSLNIEDVIVVWGKDVGGTYSQECTYGRKHQMRRWIYLQNKYQLQTPDGWVRIP